MRGLNYILMNHTAYRALLLNVCFTPLWVCCLLMLPGQAQELPPETAAKIRGLWIVRHNMNSPEAIERFLKFAEQYRFTDLFVQVRGRGDAYYESHFEPTAEGVNPGFDPLSYLLLRNESYRFRIHAWVNIFYFWSSPKLPADRNHLIYQKPDWLVYPLQYDSSGGDSASLSSRRNAEGLYHSPLNKEVQAHLLNVVHDILANYKVDGIHLDYIRFPGIGYDYQPDARKAFREKYLLDPLDFQKDPDAFVSNFGINGYELFYSRWAQFLRDGLSEFVETLAYQVHYDYPRVVISAAVKPDLTQAHWEFYQEWDRWLTRGWLDWAIPMNYTADPALFRKRTERMLAGCDPARLLMGISLYNQSPEAALQKILAIENDPIVGYVLFSYDQFLQDPDLQRKYLQFLPTVEADK